MNHLNMTAVKETTTQLKPIIIRKVWLDNEPHWLIHEANNAVKIMYPEKFFTSRNALEAFCAGEGINPADTIVKEM